MSATDKLRLASNGTQAVPTSLASPMANGATTATLNVATGWPTATGVDVVMYLVDTSGNKVAGSQTSWVFQLTGTTLSGGVLKSGTMPATGYPSGSSTVVTVRPTAAWGNDLVNTLLGFVNQDGSLKSTPVKTALGVSSTTGGGWDILNAGTAPTVASGYNNGNKEYALTFTGVDLTSTLSAGMRLKFDRSVTAPTQCMAFTAASSQYATKASPTGFSFTNTVTLEGWVRLNSYSTTRQFAGGRADASNEWSLSLTTSGQVRGVYGSSSTFTEINSYQSLPLNRNMHIAFVVSSASAKTMLLYINGVSVPFTTISSAATAIGQSGNFNIGAYITPAQFFDGYISEFRVWSTARTATNIQDNMAISLTGSETGLVGLWQGNGNFTDKTTNGNTLTATGGAIATQAANPYNTTEYAIVTKVAFATGNTTVTVFTGTDYNIPLATLINPFSSYQKAPFGFPASRGKWTLISLLAPESLVSGTVTTSVYSYGFPGSGGLSVPTGEWIVGVRGTAGADGTTGGRRDTKLGLTTSIPSGGFTSFSDPDFVQTGLGNGATFLTWTFNVSKSVTLASQTTYTVAGQMPTTTGNLYFNPGGLANGFIIVTAECSYI